jgi:hypothetical protein
MSVFVAHIAGRRMTSGTDYQTVLQEAGLVVFVGYGLGKSVDSIWEAQAWSTTARQTFDGLLNSLVPEAGCGRRSDLAPWFSRPASSRCP